MNYSDLYAEFRGVSEYVSRTAYKDAVLRICGLNTIRHFRMAMDKNVSRGAFLKPTNEGHQFVQAYGGNIIITARGMNRCWDRFVYCKELMHVFSSGDSCADTGERFEVLMTELTSAPTNPSGAFLDEIECFWRALALICPRSKRDKFRRRLQANEISEYDVALQLKIPEVYVSRLFWSRFDEFLDAHNLN